MLPHSVSFQCIPKLSHISSLMVNQSADFLSQFRVVVLVLSQNFMWLQNISGITSPLSAASHQPLCSLDQSRFSFLRKLYYRSIVAQTRSFATIGPFLWNAITSSLCLTMLSLSLGACRVVGDIWEYRDWVPYVAAIS